MVVKEAKEVVVVKEEVKEVKEATEKAVELAEALEGVEETEKEEEKTDDLEAGGLYTGRFVRFRIPVSLHKCQRV